MFDNKNVNIGKLILTLFMTLVVVAGGTFAWFTYQSRSSALVLSIGDINDSKVIIKPYEIKETLTPVNAYTSGVYSQVTGINNTSKNMMVTLYYNINELSEDLINNGLLASVSILPFKLIFKDVFCNSVWFPTLLSNHTYIL